MDKLNQGIPVTDNTERVIGYQDEPGYFLGYQIEYIGNEPGKAGYKLHGPKATYTLMRQFNRPAHMYAINSHGNICGIKGNYHFSDETGTLHCIY